MNTEWIARLVLVTVLILASAIAVERVLAWFNRARRWMWLGAMVAVIGIPIIAFVAPTVMPALGIEKQRPIQVVVGTAETTATAALRSESVADAGHAIVAAVPSMSRMASTWIALSSMLFAFSLTVATRLAVLRNRARPAVADGVSVRLTTNLGPLVTGLKSPVILLPEWVMKSDEVERRLILAHEQEHIAGGDNWLVPFGMLLVIAMPWNPALWMLYVRLRLAIETDCDARVIASGADRREYGAALIRVAGSAGPHSALSPAWSNRARQLEERVRAMTATKPRGRVPRSLLLGAGAMALLAIACDAAAPDAAASELPVRSARQHSLRVKPDAVAESTPVKMHLIAAPASPREASGTIRVTGYTRPSMRARVTFDGTAGRLVVLSGRVLRRVGDVEVDIITPAEFRVEGKEFYRIVATSLEAGEVEIAGDYADEHGLPASGSARGPFPGMRFPGAQRVVEPVQNGRLAKVTEAERAASEPVRERVRPPFTPGQILLESESGKPAQVRVMFSGAITAINGRAVAGGGEEIATTPFAVSFAEGEFAVAFFTSNPADSISIDGFARDGGWSVHTRRATATVVFGCRGGGGIGLYKPETPLSEQCKR